MEALRATDLVTASRFLDALPAGKDAAAQLDQDATKSGEPGHACNFLTFLTTMALLLLLLVAGN
jgi:hypothetical protein